MYPRVRATHPDADAWSVELCEHVFKQLLFIGDTCRANESFNALIGWRFNFTGTEALGNQHFEVFKVLIGRQVFRDEPLGHFLSIKNSGFMKLQLFPDLCPMSFNRAPLPVILSIDAGV